MFDFIISNASTIRFRRTDDLHTLWESLIFFLDNNKEKQHINPKENQLAVLGTVFLRSDINSRVLKIVDIAVFQKERHKQKIPYFWEYSELINRIKIIHLNENPLEAWYNLKIIQPMDLANWEPDPTFPLQSPSEFIYPEGYETLRGNVPNTNIRIIYTKPSKTLCFIKPNELEGTEREYFKRPREGESYK